MKASARDFVQSIIGEFGADRVMFMPNEEDRGFGVIRHDGKRWACLVDSGNRAAVRGAVETARKFLAAT